MSARMQSQGACRAGLALLLTAHLLCNVWWLWADNHPVTADEALHMQFAEAFHVALFAQDDASLGARLSDAAAIETIYPPLLHVAGALLWLITPYSGELLAFVGTIALLMLLAGVYRLTSAFLSPQRALLAATLVGFTPFLFGASRLFIQDVPAAAFVVWTLYAAHRTGGFQRTGWVAVLALLAGFGLLTRWTTPLYYTFPALLLLAAGAWSALRDETQRGAALRRFGWNAGLVAGLSLVLALPWYWARLETLRTGYETVFAGRQGQFDWTSVHDWTFYLILLINTGTFLPLFLLACVGFPIMFLRREERLFAAVLLLWLVSSYVLLTITWPIKSPAPRYVIPFLPVFGIAGAAALSLLPKGRWRMVGGAVVAGVFLLQYVNLTFAPIRPLHRVEIPVFTAHPAVQALGNDGLVVNRDRVRASAARYYSAFRGENWIDRVLLTLYEQDRFRHRTDHPRLNYGLVRLPKVGLERQQGYYRPERKEDAPRFDHKVAESYRLLTGVSPGEMPEHAGGNDELTTWLARPMPVSAYSVTYPDEDAALVRFVPQFWDEDEERWKSMVAPSAPMERDGLTHLQPTQRVIARGLRLRPTRASLEPRIEDASWYASVYPYRPIAIVVEEDSLDALGDDLANLEYIVVGDLQDTELKAIQDNFVVLDRFDAHLSGYWEPVEISILARRDVLPG